MIGKSIVWKEPDYSSTRNEDKLLVERSGIVLDAYTKLSSSSMPNGHTYNHNTRVYVVESEHGLKEIEIGKVVRILGNYELPKYEIKTTEIQ